MTVDKGAANLPAGHETVLVVDDETIVRRLVVRTLGSLGYTVLEAADGPGALRLLEQQAPAIDLLVTDVVMPHMTGPRLAEIVRAQRPGLRVLFLSGYLEDEDLRRILLSADSPLLQKPFSAGDLAQAVRRTIDGPSAG